MTTLPGDGAVLFEMIDEHVALVTLNRPEKRNAVNGAITQGMDAAIKRTEADPNVRVVILTSSNDKVFCAGADLAEVAAGNAKVLNTADGGFAGFVYHPRTRPWIAAAVGTVVAGGMEMCLACDMIVASETSVFGLPEVKRSLVAGAGGVTRLPRVIPRAIALEMITTGDPIDARRAYEIGLVNRVVPSSEVVNTALAMAKAICVNAPLAVREAVQVAKASAFQTDEESRANAMAAMDRIRLTEDFKEGPRAFVEKRAPVWKGQ